MNHDLDSHDFSFTKHVVDYLPGATGLTITNDNSVVGCKLDVNCSEKIENPTKDMGIDSRIFMHFAFFILVVAYVSRKC